MSLEFEWDAGKAEENRVKHGVSFDEASSAFADTLSLTVPDPDHSIGEERFVLVGMSAQNRLVIVVHTEHSDKIRLISARLANPREQRNYQEGE